MYHKDQKLFQHYFAHLIRSYFSHMKHFCIPDIYQTQLLLFSIKLYHIITTFIADLQSLIKLWFHTPDAHLHFTCNSA